MMNDSFKKCIESRSDILFNNENRRGASIYEKTNVWYSGRITKRMVFNRISAFNKKYGIEIATSKIEDAPFLRDQVTEFKIGAGLQYDKYDDEYIIEF